MGSNPGFTKASPSSRFGKSNIKMGNELDKVNTFNPANRVESIKTIAGTRIYRNAEGKRYMVSGFLELQSSVMIKTETITIRCSAWDLRLITENLPR